VQAGTGVNIIGNEFRNITEGACSSCHTDAIQLLGAPDSVIRGNYFRNVATAIVAFDGVVRATIEDNVIDTGGCAFNLPCGSITLDRKSADPPGSGTIVVDNIATSISTVNGSATAERHHNLVRSGAAGGDLSGAPAYSGGAMPTTWSGFELVAGSPGKGAASSPPGSDVGASIAPPSQRAPRPPGNVRIVD
jgi:hypothetical protein